MYDTPIKNPTTSTITTTDANISAAWEPETLKLKISKGNDTIENKSTMFLYFILSTTFPSSYGLNLLIKMTITKAASVRMNIMNNKPCDLSKELSLWY